MLLDTTVLIDADRSGSSIDEAIDDEDDVAIAAVTLAELLVGVGLSKGKRRKERQQFVDDLSVAVPILDYDSAVAATHADLLLATRHQGRPRGAHDLIIAATAMATRREVVSADIGAYQGLPGVAL